MWPSSCLGSESMEVIKGRKTHRNESRHEQMFRFPSKEEIWEVACPEEGECDEREAQTVRKPLDWARGKRPDLPIAS